MASGVITDKDTWWGQVIDGLDGELLVNQSISGSADSSLSFLMMGGDMGMEPYCDAIKTCMQANGCGIIDLYNLVDPYETMDGAHPTAAGMTAIANAVLAVLGA